MIAKLKYIKIMIVSIFLIVIFNSCQNENRDSCSSNSITRLKTPIMGWASWNNYRVNINEEIIKSQADAMVTTGMNDAGYKYINVDDGFFGGRDESGNLLHHPTRFPNGMKSLADYIHSKGLKAGIYTDAGVNTCASYWDKDTIGVGMGLYGHDYNDLSLMLNSWGYDFIKIDWCGGQWLELDEQIRYTEIGKIIRELNPSVIYNICRWQFPGKWVVNVADSWRISGDIANNFESVMNIVDINSELWKFSGPGHFNDMDMLQVGRGMSYEEDKTHFTMWCIMSSPLIAGNDLTEMSNETLEILTNKDLIKVNQDPFAYQARKIEDNGDLEIWSKPLKSSTSGLVVVTLLNRSEKEEEISFRLSNIGIDAEAGYLMRDLWSKEKYKKSNDEERKFSVKSHSVKVLRIEGTSKPYNIYQISKNDHSTN